MASKNQRPLGKKKQKFVEDPNARRIISMDGGKWCRIFSKGKSYHVEVGSTEFYERLSLVGDRDTQLIAAGDAGLLVDAGKLIDGEADDE